MAGLDDAASQLDLPLRTMLAESHRFVHATTQSSNAIFAFAGAKTAVVTTRGFGDTLTIMRATGRVAGLSVFERHHYRMTQKPRLLADERDIFELDERMDYAGRPVVPLDETGLRAIARTLKARGYESVAVAFLFSHKNGAHERAGAGHSRERDAGRVRLALERGRPGARGVRAQCHGPFQRLCRTRSSRATSTSS